MLVNDSLLFEKGTVFHCEIKVNWKSLIEVERLKHGKWLIKSIASRGLAIATSLLCFYLGFADSVGKSPFWNEVDKGMHFLVFGIFSLAFLQYARCRLFTQMNSWPRLLILFALLGSICVLGEAVHLFIPSRTFELNDMLANMLGTIVFGIPYVLLIPFNQIISHEQSILGTNVQQMKDQGIRLRKRSIK